MGKFKVGDKVVVSNPAVHSTNAPEGTKGTIIDDDGPTIDDDGTTSAAYKLDFGTLELNSKYCKVYDADELSLDSEKPVTAFKVGDRVRLKQVTILNGHEAPPGTLGMISDSPYDLTDAIAFYADNAGYRGHKKGWYISSDVLELVKDEPILDKILLPEGFSIKKIDHPEYDYEISCGANFQRFKIEKEEDLLPTVFKVIGRYLINREQAVKELRIKKLCAELRELGYTGEV